MKIFNYLKQLYSGENALSNHISLFSLIGIMVILANNLVSVLWNKLLVNFFSVPPSSGLELWLDMFFGLLIFIYLLGYRYRYVNSLFNDNNGSLIDFNLEPFVIVLKIFPVIFIWQIYLVLFSVFIGFLLISLENSALYYLAASFVICLMPFVYLIYIDFAKNFKYKLKYFSPKFIFFILGKYLGSVIYLFLELVVLSLIPAGIVTGIAFGAKYVSSEIAKLGLQLFALCTGVYFAIILKYIFTKGIVDIMKSNQE